MSTATALSDGFVVAKRNLIKIKRVPDMIVFTTMSPIMFILLFAYVFGSAIDTGAVDYREFLIAGIFAQTVIFGATLTGVRPSRSCRVICFLRASSSLRTAAIRRAMSTPHRDAGWPASG